MRFSKKIIPKQFSMYFSGSQTNTWYVIFGKLIPETYFLVTDMKFFGRSIPKTKIYLCNLFWLECRLLRSCLGVGISTRNPPLPPPPKLLRSPSRSDSMRKLVLTFVAWLPKFCRNFGVLKNLSSTNFFYVKRSAKAFLQNPKSSAELWRTFGSWTRLLSTVFLLNVSSLGACAMTTIISLQ